MCYASAYFWREEELNAFKWSFQSQSSDKENGEDQVGQGRGNVHSLHEKGSMSPVCTAHTNTHTRWI